MLIFVLFFHFITTIKSDSDFCGSDDQEAAFLSAAISSRKWDKLNLTWQIERYPHDVPISIIEREVKMAFNAWSDVSALRFNHEPDAVNTDIRIEFGELPILVSSTAIAVAWFPTSRNRGKQRYKRYIDWNIKEERNFNLYDVALHEIGHTLGLPHSHVERSIMFPVTNSPGYNGMYSRGLDETDIINIQALYGKNPDQTNELDSSTDCKCGRECRKNNSFKYGKCMDEDECYCWNDGTAQHVKCGCEEWCKKNDSNNTGGKCIDGENCLCSQ